MVLPGEQNVVQSLAIVDRVYVTENDRSGLADRAADRKRDPNRKRSYPGM
jgi:hypothetical protein